MFVKLLGKRWKLTFKPLGRSGAYGLCTDPSQPNKEILIDVKLQGCHRLEILIHEMLHACNWQLDEEVVTQQAHDIARCLWRLGYRDVRIEEPSTKE